MTVGTIALPSKGAIAEPTYNFLKDCGLKIHKPNPRQYVGTIPAIPSINVLFQRVKDIVYKVTDGTAQVGITGYDVVCENPHDDLIVIHDALGYGHCRLSVAVPEAWVDVQTIDDFAEVALDFREKKGRNIRIATTYDYLSRQYLHQNRIHHFTLVRAEGAIEAAPTIGYADAIIDLTQTGTTLRENHLKEIKGGTIVESQACLIGNKSALLKSADLREAVRVLCEYIDATQNGTRYEQITVNMRGNSSEEVGKKVAENVLTHGLAGPTVAPIFGKPMSKSSSSDNGYTVTITVSNKQLLQAVDYLRSIGGMQVVVSPVHYVFMGESPTYKSLLKLLELN